jgi:hypothetical protein
MRGRSIFFLPALLFPALLLGAQQASSDLSTVDDLVRVGIANNKDLAAVRERIAEAKGLKRQAGVSPAPSLSLNGATGKPLGTIGQEEYGAEYSRIFRSALRKLIYSNVICNSHLRFERPMQRYWLSGTSSEFWAI